MALWSNWSDGTKWLMGIVSALIISATIALASQFWRSEPANPGSSQAPVGQPPKVTPGQSDTPAPSATPVPAVVQPKTEPAVQIAAATPPDSAASQGGSVQSDTKNGVRIDLLDCKMAASRVTCSATMTQARDGYNHVVGGSDGSYIWDMQGNQYPLSRVKLGAKEGKRRVDSNLPANIPTRVELVFESVPSDQTVLRALVIATYKQKFTFQDIPLSR